MIKKKQNKKQLLICLILFSAALFINGCQMTNVKKSPAEQLRKHREIYSTAVDYNKEGLQNVKDPNWAEKLFKKAIVADPFYGPAHNNLAVLLKKKNVYEAAKHFELAVKYMPSNIEPLFNLGQLSESTGRITASIDYYNKALELNPDDISLIQALCRAKIKVNRNDSEISKLLQRIAGESQSNQWQDWAKEQMFIISKTAPRMLKR